jgi:hypothetical protein
VFGRSSVRIRRSRMTLVHGDCHTENKKVPGHIVSWDSYVLCASGRTPQLLRWFALPPCGQVFWLTDHPVAEPSQGIQAPVALNGFSTRLQRRARSCFSQDSLLIHLREPAGSYALFWEKVAISVDYCQALFPVFCSPDANRYAQPSRTVLRA